MHTDQSLPPHLPNTYSLLHLPYESPSHFHICVLSFVPPEFNQDCWCELTICFILSLHFVSIWLISALILIISPHLWVWFVLVFPRP